MNAGRKGNTYRTEITDGRGNEYRTACEITTAPEGNKYRTEGQEIQDGRVTNVGQKTNEYRTEGQ